jgi:hypothetical protein
MNIGYITQLCKSSIPLGIARLVKSKYYLFFCKPLGLQPEKRGKVASLRDARSVGFHLILPSDANLTACGKAKLDNI